MRAHYDEIGEAGLQFFGKITASTVHEVKNVLAIINENAGLLDDFVLMSQKGRPLDPARLENTAQNILRHIRRADGIMKNMSRFAHSVDESEKQIDLNETVELVIRLCSRLATMRGVSITITPFETPVMLTTNPFLFENLVWLVLDCAMVLAGSGKTLVLAVQKKDAGVRLGIGKIDDLEKTWQQHPPTQQLETLLAVIGAGLRADFAKGELSLVLSERG